jgi:chaperone modulatory protein CbpM
MRERETEILEAVVWDDTRTLTLKEVCLRCGIEERHVVEMVDYGIIEPVHERDPQWRFSGTCLRRVTTVVRLQRDLGVNLPGAALALDLMDQLAAQRRRG